MRSARVLLLICLFAAGIAAQNTATVDGIVYETRFVETGKTEKKIVSGATVTLTSKSDANLKFTAATDAAGRFQIDGIPPGGYILFASRAVVPGDLGNRIEYTESLRLRSGEHRTTSFTLLIYADIACGSLRNCPHVEETVTVSVNASQPIDEVSKTVNIIDGQEMRDRADFSLVDTLRTIPGFRVQQLGGFGRTSSIKTRGLRNQDTAILIDGIRFRDVAAITGDASPFLSDITLTSISRIEVLRGSGSSIYGTNAIGGTVDFQTPRPQSGVHGQFSAAVGELGLTRFRGNISKGTDDGRFGISLAASHTNYSRGIDSDDDARNTNIQSRADFQVTPKTNISLRVFGSDADVRLNSEPEPLGLLPPTNAAIIEAIPNVTFVADADDPDNFQRSKFFNGQIAVTHAVNEKLVISGHYSGLGSSRLNQNGPLGAGFQSASTSLFEGSVHTLNGHADWTLNPANDIKAGYEFETEEFTNRGSSPNPADGFFTNARQSSHTIFVQDLVHLMNERLQISGGARAQFFSLSDPQFSVTNAPFSNLVLQGPPAAYTFDGSASYYFQSTGTKIRMHVGNGYRVPSLFERLGTFFSSFGTPGFTALGDPFLKPERTIAFDGGIEQSFAGEGVKLTAVYFYTKLIDTIGFGNVVADIGDTPRPTGGYRNQRGGIARGLEFSGRVRPSRSTDIFASYTFTNSDQSVPQITGNPSLETLGIPKHTVTINATQRIKRLWINFDLVAASRYNAPIFDGISFRSYVYRFRGNFRADLTAGYTFALFREKISLRLFGTMENLFDYEYFENGFRTPGRNSRVGLSIGF